MTSSISIQDFPSEVLIHIFSYTSAKQLGLCCQVCSRWKEIIIDGIFESDKYWLSQCKKDFGELAKTAYNKSQSGLTWREIYRTLSLWPKLLQSKESKDQFAATTNESDEIYGFQVLQKGVVGVHTARSIVYYYIKDLKPVDTPKIIGSYLKYMENEDTRVYQSLYFHLFVIRKYVTQKNFQSEVKFDDVKIFKLINRFVYFVTFNDDLCVCDLNDSKLSYLLLSTLPKGVLGITVRNNNIYVLTKMYIHVYEIDKRKLCYVENLCSVGNPFDTLSEYGFLDEVDQHVYFPWMNINLSDSIPYKLMRDITCIKTYGDIVFVGTKYGNFRIYHRKTKEDVPFLYKKPIKEYDFMNNAELSVCIHQIDVVEGDDQHTVLVALENKIVSLNFSHKIR